MLYLSKEQALLDIRSYCDSLLLMRESDYEEGQSDIAHEILEIIEKTDLESE